MAAVLAGNATARDDGRYSGSPLKPWFDTLRSAKGLCCSVADGLVVADPDYVGRLPDNVDFVEVAPVLCAGVTVSWYVPPRISTVSPLLAVLAAR